MFVALSLFLPYFFGLGCLVHRALIGGSAEIGIRRQSGPRDIGIILLAGIVANYLIVLALGHLGRALAVGALLAVLGLGISIRERRTRMGQVLRENWPPMCVILYVILLFVPNIFLLPLSFWDARSIWFFHAKMIFFNQALDEVVGWTDPALGFSLVAYPKLVPVLAAQFAYLAGFWNEHLPKAALLTMLIPAVLASSAFIRPPGLSAIYLLAALFLVAGMWLWNGVIDGYLAVYAALSTLFLGKWFEGSGVRDLYAGILCLGAITSLKNEGVLFCLAVLTSGIILALVRRRTSSSWPAGFRQLRTWLWLAFSLLGIATWYVLKWKWEIATDPFIDMERLMTRLSDGSLVVVLEGLLLKQGVAKAMALFLIAAGLVGGFRLHIPPSAWLGSMTAIVYLAGMSAVYLATPFDLGWHIGSSSVRTMLPVLLTLFAATFSLLRTLEGADQPRLDRSEAPVEPG